MGNKSKVLVTGGAGFIGSQVNWMLHEAGFDTIILDNLSSGDERAVIRGTLVKGDLADKRLLSALFSSHSIHAVIHFAALTDVGESVQKPNLYYDNNVTATLNLLEAMCEAEVRHLIFSSSAAVYGIPDVDKVTETSPCSPINPYGETKLICEKMIRDFSNAYRLRACSLRYFNAAGGDPARVLKQYKKKENNLIPLVLTAMQKGKPLTINGTDYDTPDGTCIRDYIHIADLGEAHILAMQKLFTDDLSSCYNLGVGRGFSVREVIKAAEEVTGIKVPIIEGPRRAGDPPILLADATLAYDELKWEPRYVDLKTIISDAWYAKPKGT